ncbi:hypothetical protein, partial [Massilia glaciei]
GASVELSAGGAVTMDDGVATTAGTNLRYEAGGVLGIGALSAVNVSLIAGSIVDSGSGDTDVTATTLRLVTTGTAAGEGAGTGAAHLQIAVATLAASVAGTGNGGLYLDEANAIVLGTVDAITVDRLAADGSSSVVSDLGMSGVTSGANLVLGSAAGSVTVLNPLTANGNILLEANSGALGITAAISSAGGSISLSSLNSITQNANILTIGGGSIDLRSNAGSVAMADGTTASAVNGNIRYVAATTITLGAISTGADVSLSASSISDSGSVDVDVSANQLRLVTTGTQAGEGAGT